MSKRYSDTDFSTQQAVIADYLSGKCSVEEICEKHGVRSTASLYKLLAQHGVKPKTKPNG